MLSSSVTVSYLIFRDLELLKFVYNTGSLHQYCKPLPLLSVVAKTLAALVLVRGADPKNKF